MNKLITNPLLIMLLGAILIGVGIDMGGKATIIAPGMVFVISGLIMGVKKLAIDP